MKSEKQLLGIFPFVDSFLDCLTALKERRYPIRSTFSPVHLPEMQEVVTPRPSLTRMFTLIGGIVGGTGLVAMAAYAHLSFRLIVWGKPVLAWIPWVVVAFEGTILMASLFSFVSWVFKSDLPQPALDAGYDSVFSGHRFGVLVSVSDDNRAAVEELLKEKGAEEVRLVTP